MRPVVFVCCFAIASFATRAAAQPLADFDAYVQQAVAEWRDRGELFLPAFRRNRYSSSRAGCSGRRRVPPAPAQRSERSRVGFPNSQP